MKATPLKIYTRGKQIWLYRRVDGKKCEYASGYEHTSQNMAYLSKNGDIIFWQIYNQKHNKLAPEVIKLDFSSYGKTVLDATEADRNIKSHKAALKQFETLCETFGTLELDEIKSLNVSAWQTKMSQNGYSAKTIKNYRSVLSLILHYARGDGLITINPLEFVRTPKEAKKEIFAFKLDEIKQIIAHAKVGFKNLLQLAFFSGMRPSEIIALEWSKVDFKSDSILVDKNRVDGVDSLPKGDKVRRIDMLPQVKEALQRQWFLTGDKSEHVFLTSFGKPFMKTEHIDNQFKKLLSNLNLPIVRFYTTKKSFITLMKSLKMNESWLIQQVGHEDKLISREHYTAKIDQNFDSIKEIAI